jgi:PAS domain S-box-containing protein
MIRVLLIDYSQNCQRSVRETLSKAGTNDLVVELVTTPREMLTALHRQTYDVCILDSPGDDGANLFWEVRGLSFTLPIVTVITDSLAVAVDAMRNGVADCLIRDQLSVSQIERTVCEVAERTRYSSLQTQRERRHLALLDHAPDFVYTHDLKGNFTSINRAGEQLTGYQQAELLRMKIERIITPESQVLVRRMIDRAVDAQARVVEEIELTTKAGPSRRVEISIHPIQVHGHTTEIQGVMRPMAKTTLTENSRMHLPAGSIKSRSEYQFLARPDHDAVVSGPQFAA